MELNVIHNETAKRPCVFFDRDGIVNEPPATYFLQHVADFRLMPGFIEALHVVQIRGYAAVIATNQRGLFTGELTWPAVNAIHDHLRGLLRREQLDLLDILCCPHGDGSPLRKPNPGMLLLAAERHGLDLGASWMVGDKETDIEAGKRAGCATVLVQPAQVDTAADFRLFSVRDLALFFDKHLAPWPAAAAGVAMGES